jgi:hypothetical protein
MRPYNDEINILLIDVIENSSVGCSLCHYTFDGVHTSCLCLLDHLIDRVLTSLFEGIKRPGIEESIPTFVSTT